MNSNDLIMLLKASGYSITLSVGAITGGTILATLLVLLAFSPSRILQFIYRVCMWVIRGTPWLVIAMLVFLSLHGMSIRIGRYYAGWLALSICFSSLFAEVIRGAIIAIPETVFDSTKSLALPRLIVLRKVLIPLVLRQGLPPYINVCVMTVKGSSILSVIGVWELTYASREIIERNLTVFQTLFAAAAIYFVICFILDRLGRNLETRLAARGFAHDLAEGKQND